MKKFLYLSLVCAVIAGLGIFFEQPKYPNPVIPFIIALIGLILAISTFKDKEITKVMTIEASGIAPAILVASHLNVPMLFAKKTEPSTLKNQDQFSTNVHSYTKNKTSRVLVSKQYLSPDDKVLIIDDFLANGEAALGLINLVEQAEAEVVGVGICVEKSFQPGHAKIEEKGVDIFSICRIASLKNNEITFVEDEQ